MRPAALDLLSQFGARIGVPAHDDGGEVDVEATHVVADSSRKRALFLIDLDHFGELLIEEGQDAHPSEHADDERYDGGGKGEAEASADAHAAG